MWHFQILLKQKSVVVIQWNKRNEMMHKTFHPLCPSFNGLMNKNSSPQKSCNYRTFTGVFSQPMRALLSTDMKVWINNPLQMAQVTVKLGKWPIQYTQGYLDKEGPSTCNSGTFHLRFFIRNSNQWKTHFAPFQRRSDLYEIVHFKTTPVLWIGHFLKIFWWPRIE